MATRSARGFHIRAGRLPGLLLGLAVAACSPDFSPNTYNTGAVQQANKAEQGVVVGVRQVEVRVAGTTGAVVGGAAGAIAGSQVGTGTASAFGGLGGSLIGSLIGTGVEHATGDTKAYEYIVRKTNNEMVSVTQKDDPPLAIGQRVLVIAGSQARIVADYTVSMPPEKPEVAKESLRQATSNGQPVTPAGAATEPAPPAPPPTPPAPGASVPVEAAPLAPPAAEIPPVPGAPLSLTPPPPAGKPAPPPPAGETTRPAAQDI